MQKFLKNRDGALSVEATISLTIFVFFLMFMLNFGQMYKAQNYVQHRLLQSGKMVSFYAYDYENSTYIETFWNLLKSMINLNVGVETSWIANSTFSTDDYSMPVQEVFKNLKGPSDLASPQEIMEKYGIEDVQITALKDGKDLDIKATYKVKLIFSFFGKKDITLHQHVRCGLWS